MTLIIAGTVRIPPDNLEALRPHMLRMVEATKAEEGCEQYAYALDVAEPGLIRIFEVWRGQAQLDAHFNSPHMAAWREAREKLGLFERRLIAYEVAGRRPL